MDWERARASGWWRALCWWRWWCFCRRSVQAAACSLFRPPPLSPPPLFFFAHRRGDGSDGCGAGPAIMRLSFWLGSSLLSPLGGRGAPATSQGPRILPIPLPPRRPQKQHKNTTNLPCGCSFFSVVGHARARAVVFSPILARRLPLPPPDDDVYARTRERRERDRGKKQDILPSLSLAPSPARPLGRPHKFLRPKFAKVSFGSERKKHVPPTEQTDPVAIEPPLHFIPIVTSASLSHHNLFAVFFVVSLFRAGEARRRRERDQDRRRRRRRLCPPFSLEN